MCSLHSQRVWNGVIYNTHKVHHCDSVQFWCGPHTLSPPTSPAMSSLNPPPPPFLIPAPHPSDTISPSWPHPLPPATSRLSKKRDRWGVGFTLSQNKEAIWPSALSLCLSPLRPRCSESDRVTVLGSSDGCRLTGTCNACMGFCGGKWSLALLLRAFSFADSYGTSVFAVSLLSAATLSS